MGGKKSGGIVYAFSAASYGFGYTARILLSLCAGLCVFPMTSSVASSAKEPMALVFW